MATLCMLNNALSRLKTPDKALSSGLIAERAIHTPWYLSAQPPNAAGDHRPACSDVF